MKHFGRAVLLAGVAAPLGLVGVAQARTPVVKVAVVSPGDDLSIVTTTVKFHDFVRARLRGGKLVSLAGRDVTELASILQSYGATLEPCITSVTEAQLDVIRARGLQRTNKDQADLAGMFHVHVPAENRLIVAQTLNASNLVEQAWLKVNTPPVKFEAWCEDTDYPPTTDDWRSLQGYRDTNVNTGGLGILGARLASGTLDPDGDGNYGLYGAGVTVGLIDVSGYDINHEDLCYVTPLTSITADDHGSAGLGVVLAKESVDPEATGEYGMGGMAPEARGYFWAGQWANGLMDASVNLPQGTIVYCTMGQLSPWYGLSDVDDCMMAPCYPYCCFDAVSGGDPAGWACCPFVNMEMTTLDNFLVAQAAVANGVIVISSAGNTAFDYDSPFFNYHRSWIETEGETGHLMIGAGTADQSHDRLGFSCYGSQVKLQGWGESVATLGYGDLVPIAGIDRNQWYTTEFGGTSSAAPIVAGAAAALQGLALEVDGQPMTGQDFYALLTDPESFPVAAGDDWDTSLDTRGPLLPNVEGAAINLVGGGTVYTYGACCLGVDFGECMMVPDQEEVNCWLAGGVYRGQGSSCNDAAVCGLAPEADRLIPPGSGAGDGNGNKVIVSDDGAFLFMLSASGQMTSFSDAAGTWVFDQMFTTGTVTTATSDLDDSLPTTPERRVVATNGAQAQVWKEFASVWQLEEILNPDAGFPSQVGAVSVGIENDVVLLGDPGNGNVQAPTGMQVNTFYRDSLDRWVEGDPILRPDGLEWTSSFGRSLAVADDLLVVGAPFWNDGDTGWDSGAIYLYRRTGDSWSQVAMINDHDEEGHAYFGESIDVHTMPNGTSLVLVSAPGAWNESVHTGAVHLYEVTAGNEITLIRRFSTPVADSAERFGNAIDLSADGTSILIGTDRAEDINGAEVGYAWVWQDVDGIWTELYRLSTRNPTEGDEFGYAVAAIGSSLSNGNQALIGSPGLQGTNVNTGAVVVYPLAYADCNDTGTNDVLDLVRANNGTVDCSDSDSYDAVYCDCNQNDIPDSCDLVAGTSVDLDGNGRPDECDGEARGSMRMADCNFNGIPDHAENLPDLNGNGRSDTCDHDCYSQWWCPADVAGWDANVSLEDLLAVLTHWGPVNASNDQSVRSDFLPGASDGALDGDGYVDSSELIGVIQGWGGCPDNAIEDMLCFPQDTDGNGEPDSVLGGWYRVF